MAKKHAIHHAEPEPAPVPEPPPALPPVATPPRPVTPQAFVAAMSDDRRRYLLHHMPSLSVDAPLPHDAAELVMEGYVEVYQDHYALTRKGREALEAHL